ncbi:MAG: ABC transporter permease [Gemmatimonadetes bacterium]|nr:ABC transporter permease [Gemmatimonadota bacterium]
MRIPLLYSVRSLLHRPATSASTALGIALVVLTFVGMLALAQGFQAAMIETGRPDNVFVIRAGSDAEMNSGLGRDGAAILKALPEVAPAVNGQPLASADVYVVVARPRTGTGSMAHVPVRGVDFTSFELRDFVRVVEGRPFRQGQPEVVVGRGLVGRIEGLELGERVRFGQQDFTVVGYFTAGGSAFESEVWGENEQLMSVLRGPFYQSLTFRLSDPAVFQGVKQKLKADPRLNLDVYRESDYFAGQSEQLARVLRFLAFFVTWIMALGAIFGAINTMDALVGYRAREIALLLTLGFRPRSVLATFLFEAVLLSLAGGVLGLVLALPINGITTSTTNWQSFAEIVFQFRITPAILLQGLAFAAVMGLLGGFLPARRASRQVIAQALRGE